MMLTTTTKETPKQYKKRKESIPVGASASSKNARNFLSVFELPGLAATSADYTLVYSCTGTAPRTLEI